MGKKYFIIILLLTLTACSMKTYTVTFVDGNEKLLTVKVKKGDTLGNIENPSKDGYLFLSWLKDGLEFNTNNPINEDMTLEASWTEVPDPTKSYMVTFNFGDELKTVSVKEGEKVAKPKSAPKKEKHKFLGWYVGETLYDFDTPVTKNFTLIAKFEKNRINIKYDLDGGTGTLEVEIEKGTIPSKPKNPIKFGYTFKEWMIDGEVYNFDKTLDKDTTIKAIYEANIYYTIKFDSDGGNEIGSETVISGNSLTSLPTPEKEGYTFLYWTYNNEEFTIDTKITEDITLVAKYEEKGINN